MKNIAVISAFPVGGNPGMLSVEFGLEDLFSPIKNIKLTRYCIEQKFTLEYKNKRIDYELLSSQDQLKNYDIIIFWGDFLQSLDYCYSDYLCRQKERNPLESEHEHINRWYKLCLLENNKNLQEKTIIFGSTLYGLHASQLKNSRYREGLIELFSSTRLVAFRDTMSSSLIRSLTGANILDGIDCAFFVDLPKPLQEITNKHFGIYSFGRSEDTIMLEKFTEIMADILKIKLVKINWFDYKALHKFEDKISSVQEASFIFTDIYHLSITAVRENIPSLLFGKGASYGANTLSDKKKEISFSQLLLNRNYIYSENIIKNFSSDHNIMKLAQNAVNILTDFSSYHIAIRIMEKKRASLRSLLIDTITK